MYAIVEVGGKQERVKVGDQLTTEKISSEIGKEVLLEKVLLIADKSKVKIGAPYITGAKVKAIVLQQNKGDKLYVYKFKAKSRYRRKKGHRQLITVLKISAIEE